MAYIQLTLPYPPSTNRLWRRAGKRIHKDAKYTAWLEEAGWVAREQCSWGLSGKYQLTILAARPDRRKRDLDNLIKPVSDLLASVGIIGDDCDCEMVVARWIPEPEGVHVRIENVDELGPRTEH